MGRLLDGYMLRQAIGTLASVILIVMSLMVLEHLPRLIDVTRLSGHRGYIVMQTVRGLLPEYGGIGLLVGLYLAIALSVRRLSMRGEIEAIEASGIGPMRWMRPVMGLAALCSGVMLLNQGWLMPAGEARLAEIGRRMEIGEFGYNLTAGQFIDLGEGMILSFRGVDRNSEGGSLSGLFLRTGDQAYSAAQGNLTIAPDGQAIVELRDGQSVGHSDGRVMRFSRIVFQTSSPALRERAADRPQVELRQQPLDSLISGGSDGERAAAYGRMLWALLVALAPVIAFVLGRPPKRRSGALGVFAGLALIVTFIKTIALLVDGTTAVPELMALAIAGGWIAVAALLLWLHRRLGSGWFDEWAVRLVSRIPRPRPKVAIAG